MTYAEIHAAVTDETFQQRCTVAMWKAAQDITAEDPETDGHQGRIDWAYRVLKDAANITPRQLAMQVLRNPTIAQSPASASDGDIQFQVNSVLGALLVIG